MALILFEVFSWGKMHFFIRKEQLLKHFVWRQKRVFWYSSTGVRNCWLLKVIFIFENKKNSQGVTLGLYGECVINYIIFLLQIVDCLSGRVKAVIFMMQDDAAFSVSCADFILISGKKNNLHSSKKKKSDHSLSRAECAQHFRWFWLILEHPSCWLVFVSGLQL